MITDFPGTRINKYTDLVKYKTEVLDVIDVSNVLTAPDKLRYANHVIWTGAAIAANSKMTTELKPSLVIKEAEVAASKVNVDAALPAYDAAMAVVGPRSVAQDAAIAAYDALVKIMMDFSVAAALISEQIMAQQAIYDLNIGATHLNWLPPPSDAQILANLQVLLNTADTEISTITSQILSITDSSSTYTDFTTKMNMYTNFERLVTEQLKQLDAFLTDDGSIDTQEEVVSELRVAINKALLDYATVVSSNNDKAMSVKATYDSVVGRMSNISTISTNIGNTMTVAKDIISAKRLNMVYKPVVFLPVKVGVLDSRVIKLDMSAAKLVEYGFSAHPSTVGMFNLIHEFVYDSTANKLTWSPENPTQNAVRTVEFKFEVLSTSAGALVSAFDTKTVANVQLYNTAGSPLGSTNNLKISTFTSVQNSSQLNSIAGNMITFTPGQYAIFDVKTATVTAINRGLISMIIPNM